MEKGGEKNEEVSGFTYFMAFQSKIDKNVIKTHEGEI